MTEEDPPLVAGERGAAAQDEQDRLPFPESLCHSCAAPARYIRTSRGSTFIYCPIFKRYPPQPVRTCDRYAPKPETPKEVPR